MICVNAIISGLSKYFWVFIPWGRWVLSSLFISALGDRQHIFSLLPHCNLPARCNPGMVLWRSGMWSPFANEVMQQLWGQLLTKFYVHIVKDLSPHLGEGGAEVHRLIFYVRFCSILFFIFLIMTFHNYYEMFSNVCNSGQHECCLYKIGILLKILCAETLFCFTFLTKYINNGK